MEKGFYEINRMVKNYPLKIVPHEQVLMMGQSIIAKHWHRSIEIVYALGGDIKLWINGETKQLHSGDIEIIHSSMPHAYEYGESNRGCSILISYNFLKEIYEEIDDIRFVLQKENIIYPRLQTIMSSMSEIYIKQEEFYNLHLRSLLYELMYLLLSHFKVEKNQVIEVFSEKYADRYKKIIDYINNNYMRNLSLEEIANVFGFSKAHFSRSFKKYMKIGYKDYLTSVRVYYARKLILETDLSMLDISTETGFSDAKAMIREFKEIFKTTPLQYRRLHKSTNGTHES
ncbi:AraC family transcriptional regulator [Paenibacillus sanguinis]|uniref:AraC family transcriptional regulator n=1 Tax=Paenibacillus sanguinis TaxID=225906 RepID=UPI000364BB5F|nr:AraC family transcriptional regulator [Paenibacillus sanguinis]